MTMMLTPTPIIMAQQQGNYAFSDPSVTGVHSYAYACRTGDVGRGVVGLSIIRG